MTTALTAARPATARPEPPDVGPPRPLADALAYLKTGIVNVYFVGPRGAGDRGWVLVDAGLSPWTGAIVDAAARRFGPGSRPSAIVLTHGHFDHVGALETLARTWDVPILAHPLEIPYLTGQAPYPPPDPTVGGGAMAALSWLYPRGPFDFGPRVRTLPDDGSVPGMPGWRWIFTPGHSPGHVSFFRESDRALIVGDAFVTTRQESLVGALSQYPELNGPPMYYTIDWHLARRSVEALAALEPEWAATGHGVPQSGPTLRAALHRLARDFDRDEVPRHGRYAAEPAICDRRGPLYVPPPRWKVALTLAISLGLGLAAGLAIGRLTGGRGRGPG